MRNTTVKTFFRIQSYYLPILFLAFFTLPFQTLQSVAQSLALNSPVELNFEYPDRIMAGESFELNIQLKKKSNYNFAGSISLIFSGGMTPNGGNIDNMQITTENNTLLITWEKLSNSNIIYIPVSVKTDVIQGGVYPVRVSYTDQNGLQFFHNIGVFVQSTAIPEPYEPPLTENPFTVTLVYPSEVYFDETYNLDIVIAKGKNISGARVFVQIPPGSKLSIDDYADFNYREDLGDLSILLNHMPASPEFTIHCKVTNTSKVNSVYPVRATVEFLDSEPVTFNDFILVTENKSNSETPNSQSTSQPVNAAINADTATLFQELDGLLTKWRQSTSNYQNDQANNPPEQQEIEITPKDNFESIFTEDVIFYSIQIAASEVVLKNIEQKVKDKGIDEKILEDYDGKIYRYSVGDFETIERAKTFKEKLVTEGYTDAFIVEYINGVRGRSIY
jgi:hypothetical protein